MWAGSLRGRIRSTSTREPLFQKAGLAPRRPIFDIRQAASLAPNEVENGTTEQSSTTRNERLAKSIRIQSQAPPHLPLPPPLPYSRSSAPFLRHLQILHQSTLSSTSAHSWVVFEGLHPDLHDAIPEGLLLDLIRHQCQEGNRSERISRLMILVDVAKSTGLRLPKVELEKTAGAVLWRTKTLDEEDIDLLHRLEQLLHNGTAGRLDQIDVGLRSQWFQLTLKRYLDNAFQAQPSDYQSQVEKGRIWIRAWAAKGMLCGVDIKLQHLTFARVTQNLTNRIFKESLEFGSSLMDIEGLDVHRAVTDLLKHHIHMRARSQWLEVDRPNRVIASFLKSMDNARGSDAWIDALESLGITKEIAMLFGIPSELYDLAELGEKQQLNSSTQKILVHRLNDCNGNNTVEIARTLNRLAVACMTMDQIVKQKTVLNSHFVKATFRVFQRMATFYEDSSSNTDVRKALIFLTRRLMMLNDETILNLSVHAQRAVINALCRYSDNQAVMNLLQHTYIRSRRSETVGNFWTWDSTMRESLEHLVKHSAKLDEAEWLPFAIKAYEQWLLDGMEPLPGLEQRFASAFQATKREANAEGISRRLLDPGIPVEIRSRLVSLIKQVPESVVSEDVFRIYLRIQRNFAADAVTSIEEAEEQLRQTLTKPDVSGYGDARREVYKIVSLHLRRLGTKQISDQLVAFLIEIAQGTKPTEVMVAAIKKAVLETADRGDQRLSPQRLAGIVTSAMRWLKRDARKEENVENIGLVV
jgi:hypothetical protein